MTQEKTIEVLRKRNAKLQGELDALKEKMQNPPMNLRISVWMNCFLN